MGRHEHAFELEGERVRERLDELGTTQRELADHLGVTARTVQNWLTGAHGVDEETAEGIGACLELGVGEFVESMPDDYVTRQLHADEVLERRVSETFGTVEAGIGLALHWAIGESSEVALARWPLSGRVAWLDRCRNWYGRRPGLELSLPSGPAESRMFRVWVRVEDSILLRWGELEVTPDHVVVRDGTDAERRPRSSGGEPIQLGVDCAPEFDAVIIAGPVDVELRPGQPTPETRGAPDVEAEPPAGDPHRGSRVDLLEP